MRRRTQNTNTRRNRIIEALGKRMTLLEWSEETGIPYDVLQYRITDAKWDAVRALTTPKAERSRQWQKSQ